MTGKTIEIPDDWNSDDEEPQVPLIALIDNEGNDLLEPQPHRLVPLGDGQWGYAPPGRLYPI